MPLLNDSKCKFTAADIAMLQPIVKHARDNMCSGVFEDHDIALTWLGCTTQIQARRLGEPLLIIQRMTLVKNVRHLSHRLPVLRAMPECLYVAVS